MANTIKSRKEYQQEYYRKTHNITVSSKEKRIQSLGCLFSDISKDDGGETTELACFNREIPTGYSDITYLNLGKISNYVTSRNLKGSESTIGRDITELAKRGYLEFVCTHGFTAKGETNGYLVNIKKISSELTNYYDFSAFEYHCSLKKQETTHNTNKHPEEHIEQTKSHKKRLSGKELKEHRKQQCNEHFLSNDLVFVNHILPLFHSLKIGKEMSFLDGNGELIEHSRLYHAISQTYNPEKRTEDGEKVNKQDGCIFNSKRYKALCAFWGTGHPEEMERLIKSKEYKKAYDLYVRDFHPYDFHSMIVRLVYDLSHDDFFDFNADGYKLLSFKVFGTEKYRELVKSELQSIIQKPEKIEFRCIEIDKMRFNRKYKDNDVLKKVLIIEKDTGMPYRTFLIKLRDEYFKLVGLHFKAAYYRIESGIYILMHSWFEERGYRVAPNIYDCFAGIDLTPERVWEAYKYAINTMKALYAKEYYDGYLKETYPPYCARKKARTEEKSIIQSDEIVWGMTITIEELIKITKEDIEKWRKVLC